MGFVESAGLRRAGRARGMSAGAALLLLLVAPGGVTGQRAELGLGISRIQNPPDALFDTSCPPSRSWSGDGRVSYRFSRAVALEGTVGYNWETGDQCVIEPEVVPPTGPFERATRVTPTGFPFVTTDVRMGFEPSNPSGSIWLKAFGGYGRMWSKDIGYWLAGGGLVFGGRIESVLEFEWNWFDIPFDETTEQFLDGILVGTSEGSGETSHTTFRIRAGVRWRP